MGEGTAFGKALAIKAAIKFLPRMAATPGGSVQDGPVTSVQVFARIVQPVRIGAGYLRFGIHTMSIPKRFRHYGRTLRERLGAVAPEQSYLFELILFLLLVSLLVLGIAWM